LKRYFLTVGMFLLLVMSVTDASPKVGTVAPDFVGYTVDGDTVRLADLRGQVVFLDFWASWCGPCREEMPFLVDFYREHRKQAFQILAVNIDNKTKNMQKFLDKLDRQPKFPILFDQKKTIPKLYDIETMPTSIFIDKNGIIRYWHNGFKELDEELFYDELRTLLKKNKEGT
jgi:peroxiredoxin